MKNCLTEPAVAKSIQILGVTLHPLSIFQLNDLISYAINYQQKWIIANQNLHSVYLYHHDLKMQNFYALADYTHIDSMALLFLGKILGFPLQREQRVTYVDWTNPLMAEAAERGWRIFYLGSKPGVAEQGAEILRKKFGELQIMTADGYFDTSLNSEENQAVLAKIQTYRPHILMVGMSMPRQEYWILDNLEQISAHAILPCGATIDYVAGAVPTPPRWAGRWGLEWLFRLLAEPGRLWQRYLIEPWFLLKLLIIARVKSLTRR